MNIYKKKTLFPNEVKDDGIVICANNKHPEKAEEQIALMDESLFYLVKKCFFWMFCFIRLRQCSRILLILSMNA